MSTLGRSIGAVLICTLMLGCAAQRDTGASVVRTPQAHDAFALLDQSYPYSLAQRPTTNGEIYLGNLDTHIALQRERLASGTVPTARAALAGSLYQRFRIVGRLSDGEEALGLMEQAIAQGPADADAYAAFASILSAFHRFGESRAALERAVAMGFDRARAARVASDLDLAEGKYALIADELAQSAVPVPEFFALASRGDLRVLLGDLVGASRQFRTAQGFYGDVDPLPLAWLHTQQGIALLRFGDAATAKRFFEAAHQRFPQYYLATEHLAEAEKLLGNYERARTLYNDAIAQTGNPEFQAGLASVEELAGNATAAAAAREQARAGYETLIARYPAAYSQHAAEFYLQIGDAARARELARYNWTLRQDVASAILLARSAQAAGDADLACTATLAARATDLHPPELNLLAAIAATCDRDSSKALGATGMIEMPAPPM